MDQKKLILVTDDSRTARQYLCSILEKTGFQTIQAENGLIAIETMQEKHPDCIILDMLMPEMDGIDVLKKMRELKLDIPVIVLTADIQDEVKEECFEFGAKGFINKPFKENEVLEAILKNIK